MVGYAYLDLDGHLIYKTRQYIEEVDPGFFSKNSHFIIKRWKFDTEDRSNMVRLLQAVSDLIPNNNGNTIKLFLRSIDYDLNNLREPDANKV